MPEVLIELNHQQLLERRLLNLEQLVRLEPSASKVIQDLLEDVKLVAMLRRASVGFLRWTLVPLFGLGLKAFSQTFFNFLFAIRPWLLLISLGLVSSGKDVEPVDGLHKNPDTARRSHRRDGIIPDLKGVLQEGKQVVNLGRFELRRTAAKHVLVEDQFKQLNDQNLSIRARKAAELAALLEEAKVRRSEVLKQLCLVPLVWRDLRFRFVEGDVLANELKDLSQKLLGLAEVEAIEVLHARALLVAELASSKSLLLAADP